MNTKDKVWQIFNEMIRMLPNDYGKSSLDFIELVRVFNAYGVSDNRTIKNYIEMMMIQNWLIIEGDTFPDPLNAITSVYKYKRCTWKINVTAKYEERSKKDIAKALFGKEPKGEKDV